MTQVKKQKGKSNPISANIIKLYAMQSIALDVSCLRGFARLCDLAKISNADEYDQVNHPDGMQRNLNKKHAREAYEYAKTCKPGQKRIWPEVILSIRRMDGVEIKSNSSFKGSSEIHGVNIRVDLDKIDVSASDPTFSRVDGNHRLYYAKGGKFGTAVETIVPFCIIQGLTRAEERIIFRTINEMQKKLSVSHLLRIEGQTSDDFEMKKNNPVLWLVGGLRKEALSPFYNVVYIAGKKQDQAAYIINQKSLLDGVALLYKSLDIQLRDVSKIELLLKILVNYYNAVKERWPNQWNDNKHQDYLLMTNTGMQALAYLGAEIIKKQIVRREVTKEVFLGALKVVEFDWKSVDDEGKKRTTGRAGGEAMGKEMIGEWLAVEKDGEDLSKMNF